ncbi:MAG TPA: glycosyltransferase family 39 protein [Terrimicrobiaceae bacterium]
MSGLKTLLVFVLAATIARVAFVWFTEPTPQEAYYFLCSQRPAPAYFDGPGGTAFVTELASIYGKSDVLWRLTAPFWGLCATVACFALVRRIADSTRAVAVALVLNALPIVNSSALRVGPELPTLTLVSLGILAAWRAYGAEGRKLAWWIASGLLFGAASWFAYASVAVLPGIACFAMYNPKRRQSTDFYGIYALFGIPALCLALPLVWNAGQDWIPIAGGTFRTLWEFEFKSFLGALFRLGLAFSPLLLGAIVLGWLHAFVESRKGHTRARFIFWCGLPAVTIGLYFILRGGSGAIYLLLVAPLLLFKAMDLFSSDARFVVALRWSAVILAIALSLYAIFETWQDGRGWRSAASGMRRVFLEKSKEGQDDLFLVAEDVGLASVLGYHLRDDFVAPTGHPTVYVRESQDISNQFSLWPSYGDFTETDRVVDEYFTEQQAENPFLGRSALYMTRERAGDLPQSIRAAFDSVILFRELPGAGGDPRPLYIYLCLVYQTLPL